MQFPAELSRLTFPSGKNRKLEKSTGRSAEIAIYLPHNPADPPKTTNTSIRHMAFHGVQEFMVLPKFTSFSFSLRQLTTTENGLKHSTSKEKSFFTWKLRILWQQNSVSSCSDATTNFGGPTFKQDFEWREGQISPLWGFILTITNLGVILMYLQNNHPSKNHVFCQPYLPLDYLKTPSSLEELPEFCARRRSWQMHGPQCVLLGTWGGIHSTENSGNFGPKLYGSVRSNRKSFEKLVHLLRWTTFPGRTGRKFWLNGSRPWCPHMKLKWSAFKHVWSATDCLWYQPGSICFRNRLPTVPS